MEEIKSLKPDLDRLHTMEIRLTGGECTINPDFIDIAKYFLSNGFHISIYTNGFNYYTIEQLLKATKDYHYFIGVSLDGTDEFHNMVRGNKNAFTHAIKTLTLLKSYSNINVLVACCMMRQNIENMTSLKQFLLECFSEFETSFFIPTMDEGFEFAFNCNEIPEIQNKYPDLFTDYHNTKKNWHIKHKNDLNFRCYGGITNGSLTVDRLLKICPMAMEDVFILGNIKSGKSLYELWINPDNKTIEYFRNEHNHDTVQCKRCNKKSKCGSKNCRLEAYRMTKDFRNANPYTCMAVKGCYLLPARHSGQIDQNAGSGMFHEHE